MSWAANKESYIHTKQRTQNKAKTETKRNPHKVKTCNRQTLFPLSISTRKPFAIAIAIISTIAIVPFVIAIGAVVAIVINVAIGIAIASQWCNGGQLHVSWSPFAEQPSKSAHHVAVITIVSIVLRLIDVAVLLQHLLKTIVVIHQPNVLNQLVPILYSFSSLCPCSFFSKRKVELDIQKILTGRVHLATVIGIQDLEHFPILQDLLL